ncbi:uncharacterized protein LOC129032992 [Pongo pygmaeus]|uniref:uncharacterized protein LOC129032992 n=1 Tax=Pongo pygmaeus TaxID=9600 RepID=UPI00300D35B6
MPVIPTTLTAKLPFFSPQHTDLAGRSLLPAPTLTRRLPSPKRCSAPGTATHAEPIGTRGGAAGSSRSAHERTLATGGRSGCNRLLSWQFCVPRLPPGRSRTYAARRSFTTSRSSGPGAARARLCPSRRCAPTGWHLSQKVQPIALSRGSSSMASSSCSPSRPLASPEPGSTEKVFDDNLQHRDREDTRAYALDCKIPKVSFQMLTGDSIKEATMLII